MSEQEIKVQDGVKDNLFTAVFARIWAFWGVASFIGTFFLIYLPSIACYLIPGKTGQYIFIKISKIWLVTWQWMIGCPLVVVKGKEHFKKGMTYIVASNHNSLLDPTLTSPQIPGANKTIAKMSFAKIPIFGFYYKKGSVLVDRDDPKSKTKSFEEMKQVIKDGMHMCIYPEGTRNKTDQPLKEFIGGAFLLATATGAPIIPALTFNTRKASPANKKFYLLPTKLEIHFLPPIETVGISTKELRDKVFKVMWDYYVAHQK